jgi:DNA-binding GntR family transcriptional regulator
MLSEQLNISPFPVREAIRRLEAVGLVKSIPHRGATVAWLSAKEISDLFEYRLILEPEAARYATRRMANSPAHIALLERELRKLQKLAKSTDVFELLRQDEALLCAVFSASENPYLVQGIVQIWDNIRPYKVMYLSSTDGSSKSSESIVLSWGKAIVEACLSGNEERAAQCVREPLEITKSKVVEFVSSLEREPK